MQSTSIYPFYEKQRQSRNTYNDQFNDSSSALIKKYNVDVRKMRENEEMLRKYEIALKKA